MLIDSLTGLIVLRDLLREIKDEQVPDYENGLPYSFNIFTAEERELFEGQPCIILAVESDEPATDWGHTARRCIAGAIVQASDFAGALQGFSNPITADTGISRFLQKAVHQYERFNTAGLWGIECTGPRETRVNDDEGPRSVNVHRITFYYDPISA